MSLSLAPLYKGETRYQSVLAVLFIVYLMSNMVLPPSLTKLVNTQAGMIVVVVLALTVFFHTHPIDGVLGHLVAYELVKTAGRTSPSVVYSQAQPTFTTRKSRMQSMQPRPKVTLEEHMVKNLVPLVHPASNSDPGATYLPVLDNIRNAGQAFN